MKINYLLPHSFKKIGLILIIPSLLLGILGLFLDFKIDALTLEVPALFADNFLAPGKDNFRFITNNLTDELAAIVFLLGAIFIAFSREKTEDEFITKIRLESLVWAVYINYGILFLCFLFIYNFSFLNVMIYNLFTVLIIFILRYYWKLFLLKKQLGHEE
ncbi:hypothetical protein SAMN05216474_0673 [Lishizhenia tianjinensis]|uniref:Uncharacterized protein n=1 Tax=Lishizhenia tianjinensis TaxID=477690 RepID=A0A1I6Y5L1_9FLAO|nr:hypothetical protein [Lishizhenia tianjinensis]SFT45788.1 hypothetical protein SAMN05216474_0673 [Lishizhenia tianjinensis]